MTVAEGAVSLWPAVQSSGLQWGRNLTVAEGPGIMYRVCRTPARFNGAAT